MRLDQYMAQYWPEYSRSTWQKYIEMGLVNVNGKPQTSIRQQLGEDDEVQVATLPVVDSANKTLPVVYEDEYVLVINKPSGVLTHAKGEVAEEFTVADFVKAKMKVPEQTNRPGIVHRLDRATSGVLIAAKDAQTKHLLQKQFQDRKAKKVYIALVKGRPKLDNAVLRLPIARNPKEPSSFRVDPNGKPAETSYRVLATNRKYSVLELKPLTGRTHQLRVHLAYIGTPILGDTVYGGSKSPIGRLCLHAQELEITIPPSLRKTFTASPPSDLQELIDAVSA